MESKNLFVFEDASPKAPIHYLIVPKEHVVNISDAPDEIWLEVRSVALSLAKKFNLSGFRLVNNYGTAQAVMHLHVHFLSKINKEREI